MFKKLNTYYIENKRQSFPSFLKKNFCSCFNNYNKESKADFRSRRKQSNIFVQNLEKLIKKGFKALRVIERICH